MIVFAIELRFRLFSSLFYLTTIVEEWGCEEEKDFKAGGGLGKQQIVKSFMAQKAECFEDFIDF